jgi:hypothetical protein
MRLQRYESAWKRARDVQWLPRKQPRLSHAKSRRRESGVFRCLNAVGTRRSPSTSDLRRNQTHKHTMMYQSSRHANHMCDNGMVWLQIVNHTHDTAATRGSSCTCATIPLNRMRLPQSVFIQKRGGHMAFKQTKEQRFALCHWNFLATTVFALMLRASFRSPKLTVTSACLQHLSESSFSHVCIQLCTTKHPQRRRQQRRRRRRRYGCKGGRESDGPHPDNP